MHTAPSETAFLPAGEQRHAERAAVRLCARLHTSDAVCTPAVAEIEDLSVLGARLVTDAAVQPGQEIAVSIPTRGCPPEMGLPHVLEGTAVATRVERAPGERIQVGVRFGEALAGSMELALYMAFLLGGGAKDLAPQFA